MRQSIPDLWPDDITVSTPTAPVTILRQQAARLGQRTKNLVEAEVRSQPSKKRGDHFEHGFYLVAPALDNYQFLLFSIDHPIDFYPITITIRKGFIEVDSEQKFAEELKKIFATEGTKRVISALISQSQA